MTVTVTGSVIINTKTGTCRVKEAKAKKVKNGLEQISRGRHVRVLSKLSSEMVVVTGTGAASAAATP